MKNRTVLYIAGCTGSNSPQTLRIKGSSEEGSTEIVVKPMARKVFGTHTTSLALVDGDIGYLIDNGSGVGQACEFLMAKKVSKVRILQTHYHLDHMSGMPQNSMLFTKGIVECIYGPRLGAMDFKKAMNVMFEPWMWPVSPAMFGVDHEIRSFAPGDSLMIGGIRTLMLNHPGGSVAYRIPTQHGDVVIATDNELALGSDIRAAMPEFIAGSLLLYADVQYRDSEYAGHTGIGTNDTKMVRKNWGHSTPLMIRTMIDQMALPPDMILIGHHDPKRSDNDLLAFEAEVKAADSAVVPTFARECQTYDLVPHPVQA